MRGGLIDHPKPFAKLRAVQGSNIDQADPAQSGR
jgi:hypothetical protein